MRLAKLNPFKHDRQRFPGVVIPLSEAPARSWHVSKVSGEKKPRLENKNLDRSPSEENGSAGSLPETSHLTIEALRAEVESDVAASGHDSAYDRMWFDPVLLFKILRRKH